MPIARCTSAAATEESTPPESPHSALPSPTRARTRAISSSMKASIVHAPRGAADPAHEVREQRPRRPRCGPPRGGRAAPRSGASRGAPPRRASSRSTPSTTKPGGRRSTRSPWLIQTTRSAAPSEALEQRVVALELQPRASVLAIVRLLDQPAEPVHEQLHAVADGEHGTAQLEDAQVDVGRARIEHARRPAREHDAARVEGADGLEARGRRVDLAVDVLLADAPRDQLRELRAEVEDQDTVPLGGEVGGGGHARSWILSRCGSSGLPW